MRANRVDARFVDRENKEMILIEMNCPWMNSRKQKEEEKTLKYAALRLELKRQQGSGFDSLLVASQKV